MIKPILFNTEMVRAILDGRKTVTRWVLKPKNLDEKILVIMDNDEKHKAFRYYKGENNPYKPLEPPYQVGDVLYVRETYMDGWEDGQYIYRADGKMPDNTVLNWTPSIHMPREAARIWLKVTDVSVERLQDITEEDVISEGIGFDREHLEMLDENWDIPFATLWDSTIKKSDLDRYGWEADPWVWKICFERCEKPEDNV